MITTSQLSYQYSDSNVLHFPDIKVQKGSSFLITGNSGKGKTTFLHLLGGILMPASGTITIDGFDLASLSGKKMDRFRSVNIGMVLQQPHFIQALNVLDNLEIAHWLGHSRKSKEKSKLLLEQLGIYDQCYKSVSQLSSGQLQRLSIARALINDPKIILADEPTSSLDDENAARVADLLSSMSESRGASLVIVTHDQRLKDLYSNKITLL